MKPKIIIFLLVIIAITFLIYINVKRISDESSSLKDVTLSSKNSNNISLNKNEATAKNNSDTITNISLDETLKKYQIEKKYYEILSILSQLKFKDEITTLGVLAILRELPRLPEFEFFNRAEKSLMNSPLVAAEEITVALDTIPQSEAPIRKELITFTSSLPIDDKTKIEFLSKELFRPIDTQLSKNLEVLTNPVDAFQGIIDNAKSNTEIIEDNLLAALDSHKDSKTLGKLLLSRYSIINKERAKEISVNYNLSK